MFLVCLCSVSLPRIVFRIVVFAFAFDDEVLLLLLNPTDSGAYKLRRMRVVELRYDNILVSGWKGFPIGSREEHVPAMLKENPVVLAPISLVFEK